MVFYLGQNVTVKNMDDGCNLGTSGTTLYDFGAPVSLPIARCMTPLAVPVAFLLKAWRGELWEGGQNSERLRAISTDTHGYLKQARIHAQFVGEWLPWHPRVSKDVQMSPLSAGGWEPCMRNRLIGQESCHCFCHLIAQVAHKKLRVETLRVVILKE